MAKLPSPSKLTYQKLVPVFIAFFLLLIGSAKIRLSSGAIRSWLHGALFLH